MKFIFSFFINILESDTINPYFNEYYNWLKRVLRNNPQLDPGQLIQCKMELLNVQLLLKDSKHKEAEGILKSVTQIFKEKEEQEKWL